MEQLLSMENPFLNTSYALTLAIQHSVGAPHKCESFHIPSQPCHFYTKGSQRMMAHVEHAPAQSPPHFSPLFLEISQSTAIHCLMPYSLNDAFQVLELWCDEPPPSA